MHSGRLLRLLAALTSLLSPEAHDVSRSGVSCLRSSPTGDRQTRVTFLREDAAGVRSLSLSSSSSSSSSTGRTAGGDTEKKVRRKRAWIFPGTLWCGTGSKAAGYEQLGMFESADRCCREHDHCLHIIPAFTVNYGVFNHKFFTVSHCDCDQRFRQCLLSVNDTISSMVGYSFFNLLKVPCFELKLQKRCTEISWWGKCKVAKEAPYAIFKSPLPYNTSNITSRYEDSTVSNKLTTGEGLHVTQSPTISPHRKSHKNERTCSTRDPPRGDTFYRRRTKGKGCKRHLKLHTVAPTQMPPTSRARSTTPSVITGLLSTPRSNAITSNKKKNGRKKSTRKGQSAYPTWRSPVPPGGTTNSYPRTTSTTYSTPPLTQNTARQLQSPAATTAVSGTTKGHRKAPKQSGCCGLETPLRGDTFQPHCKSCLEQKKTSGMTTVTAPATTYGFTSLETLQKTAKTPEQNTLKRPSSTEVSVMPATIRLKTAASNYKEGKARGQMDSRLFRTNTSQEHLSTRAWRHLKQNIALHNMTDKKLLCGSLKYLDDCKHKIPPLEKKYDLRNTEPKTAYHCDCTTRLAVQIESSKQPAVLCTLLMDFVSQHCFKLSRKKCHGRKSCSGGFTKASDLLRAVKKIEEKDTAGVRNSSNGRKRRIPVRLYKRCLRLQREADIMARLT